jgi:malonyl CoA-acyl carrier protein transacylase
MWENKCFSSIGITAVQLGLTNMLAQHGVKPDVVIGHSMGEIACAYADDCMSETQCIHIAYIRSQLVALLDPDTNIFIYTYPIEGNSTSSLYELINQYNGQYTYRVRKEYSDEFESNHRDYVRKFDNQGAMLFVSMLEDVANKVILSLSCHNTVIACYNSLDGLTLSGPKPEITKLVNYCIENSVFHRAVETGNIAYHSPLLSPYELYLIEQVLSKKINCDFYFFTRYFPRRLRTLFHREQPRPDRASGYRLQREVMIFAMLRITLVTLWAACTSIKRCRSCPQLPIILSSKLVHIMV